MTKLNQSLPLGGKGKKIQVFNWWNDGTEKPTWFRVQYWKRGEVFMDGDTLQIVLCNIELQIRLGDSL